MAEATSSLGVTPTPRAVSQPASRVRAAGRRRSTPGSADRPSDAPCSRPGAHALYVGQRLARTTRAPDRAGRVASAECQLRARTASPRHAAPDHRARAKANVASAECHFRAPDGKSRAAAAAPIARSASEGERRVEITSGAPGRQVPAAAAGPIARSASEGERRVRRMPTPAPEQRVQRPLQPIRRRAREQRRTSRPPNANSAPRTGGNPSGPLCTDQPSASEGERRVPPNANSAPRTASPSGRCGPESRGQAKANITSAECQLRARTAKYPRPQRPRSQGAQAKAYFPYAERRATPRAGAAAVAGWRRREGFEPSEPFRVHALSRRVPSATRPSLRGISNLARRIYNRPPQPPAPEASNHLRQRHHSRQVQRPMRPRSQGAQAKAYFPYAERRATQWAGSQRLLDGGEGGIRTLDTVSRMQV